MCQQMSVRRYKFRYSVQMGLQCTNGATVLGGSTWVPLGLSCVCPAVAVGVGT